MSIIRAPRPEGNFYLLNKTISEDQRLSWGARGMLVFLLKGGAADSQHVYDIVPTDQYAFYR